ncbi:uncharacterized protein METZ01_LOCUS27373, partial [marine metagenome]
VTPPAGDPPLERVGVRPVHQTPEVVVRLDGDVTASAEMFLQLNSWLAEIGHDSGSAPVSVGGDNSNVGSTLVRDRYRKQTELVGDANSVQVPEGPALGDRLPPHLRRRLEIGVQSRVPLLRGLQRGARVVGVVMSDENGIYQSRLDSR